MNKQLGNKTSKHLYEVEVIYIDGRRMKIDEYANSRAQASKIANQWDFSVASVNMIG